MGSLSQTYPLGTFHNSFEREKLSQGNSNMRRIAQRLPALVGLRFQATIGTVASAAEVGSAAGVPAPFVSRLLKPSEVNWTRVDVIGRKRLAALASTASESAPLYEIRNNVAKNPPKQPVDPKKAFAANFTCINALVTTYEEVLYPVRALQKEWEDLDLESFGLKDDLKRGTSAFKQAHLDKAQARLDVLKKTMSTKRQQILTVASQLTTAMCNDIINALRIVGETQEHGRRMAFLVLEDMTLFDIAFDDTTKLLLKNLSFGDGPFEDSNMLFSLVEYPERGEISLSGEPLERIADHAIKTISTRHQTPITDGKLLRSGETHPLLQRSPE
jgi:hypothetical protein